MRGLLLFLSKAALMSFVAMSGGMASEAAPGKVESSAQAPHLTHESDKTLTIDLSSINPRASCSLTVDCGSPPNHGALQADSTGFVGALQRIVRFLGSISDTQVWIQLLTVALVLFSTYVSFRTAQISRFNVQVDTYQKLRTGFQLLNAKLPTHYWTRDKLPEGKGAYDELCAMERYWYQSYDEWYITQVLHPRTLGRLWFTYYKNAIFKNRDSAAMIAALIRTKEHSGTKLYRKFSRMVVYRGWWRMKIKIKKYDQAVALASAWEAHMIEQKRIHDDKTRSAS
jgi:hypothetical protein